MKTRTLGSPSLTYCWDFDVFLSFRGKDTRFGFTGYLYDALRRKEIRTFIDDVELRKGEEITPFLLKAIENSRIAIIVFSKDYASSTFCLEELVEILERMKQNNRLVFPVFYKVDPCDVRHQKGSWGEALAKHEARFKDKMMKVQKWKSALSIAASLSGCHIRDEYEYEHKFIDNITEEICKKIKRIPLQVATYPIGLESRVQVLNILLDTQSVEKVNMVGIHGIGGIGKTATACAVYNFIADQFEGLCFLSDIRESSKHDLVKLQEKLLVDILGEKDIKLGSVKEGIPIIKHRLQRKKVLLVLDDVNELEQLQALAGGLDWFGSGSKIIITTRDKHLLLAHGVDTMYEVEGLNYKDALELFSWNAFKNDKVDPSYIDLSKRAVHYCDGHPLALEVIGSNLCKRGRAAWESALNEYERIPNKTIYKILKVSYDGLEDYQQKIFLDLACFFRGCNLDYVTNILLHGRDLDPKCGIDELIDKSLIKIDQCSCVRIHDLIQHMGREIVRQESPSEPGRRSRLWFYKDILHVLEENMGTNDIEVMVVDLPSCIKMHWDGDAFKKMKNLQVLIIRSACFSTQINHLPTSLRLLEWDQYPHLSLPSDFCPRNLVALKMTESCLVLDKPLENFKSLSHLNLSGNKFLREVPDISGAPNLVELCLKDCKNLSEVHNSVGVHSKLRVLDAEGCISLIAFPRQILMKSLEFLGFSKCYSLQSFPEIPEQLEKLTHVNLNSSGIQELPFSIRNLVGLQDIELDYCNSLYRLPDSILTLPKLKSLGVKDCKSERFLCFYQYEGKEQEQERVSFIAPPSMKFISLKDCNLTDDFLPTRLPYLPDLEVLSLNSCKFSILPVSIREFHFLGRLDLIACNQLREIREIPQNIKRVLAINCTSLTSESSGKLLSQKLHEPGNTYFVLPGSRIPEWFDHCCEGPSLPFWFRKKFPSVALSIILSSSTLESYKLVINSTQKIFFHIGTHPKFMRDHIYLFDLKMRTSEDEIKEVTIKKGWNLVEVSCVSSNKEEMPKWVGVYAYKQKNNMEDISFIRPDYPKRKFDDFLNYNPDSELVGDQSLKRHPALMKKLDRMPIWCCHAVTPIILEAIWSMQAPPSIKILLWEICQHELLTCADLYTKKLSDSPICHICKGEPETLEHVFLLCPWTRPIWFECEFQWIVDVNSLKCIEVWLCQKLQKIKRTYPNFSQVNGLLGCIFWAIWNGRNGFVFDGKPVNPMKALKRAETLYKEYSSSLYSN